ncbi:hypothetical protein PS918_01452 [Pseudomonas fluorescens]|uniref:Uncharacterized protein n=1 Tax=Pseudomonas fluorescens TaxID=294 RepID=A0A5E7REN5_PSEFL|nr:hypothetical protein [Pseudomonas fluorescens]VVP72619.1 hypothetical protein PS918_01452 [Pseudomonas fluorescens]
MKRMIRGLGWLVAFTLTSVEAANQEVKLRFQPDFPQPGKNEFVNQTPNTGYCAKYPVKCAERNIFSFNTPIRFNSTRAVVPGDGVGFKAPANWRQVTVTNQITRQSETVEVRIVGIGSEYVLSDTAANLTDAAGPWEGHEKLWGSQWFYAPPPCATTGAGVVAPYSYGFFWDSPTEAYCNKRAAYMIPKMAFDSVDFAYELRLPDPLGMLSGLYTGSLTYIMGVGGDFEMGPAMQPSDSHLTLDFELDVQHTLKVDLPPGGSKVAMEPKGGWQRWIDNGRRPTEIYRDQPFFLSASSSFKVKLICSSLGGSECEIGNSEVGFSKFQVRLTVPRGIAGPGGADGWTGTLNHNTWIGPFEPTRYVDRKPGNLRFQMPSRWIESLLRPGMNGTLRGFATLIFDSEV